MDAKFLVIGDRLAINEFGKFRTVDPDTAGECECCEDPNCDRFKNWTLEAKFCGQTLVWDSGGFGSFRLNFPGGYICTARSGSMGWNCGPFAPELELIPFDEENPHPFAGSCYGRLEVIATAPIVGGGSFCFRAYQADIVDGELENVIRTASGDCGCDDQIEITLRYGGKKVQPPEPTTEPEENPFP